MKTNQASSIKSWIKSMGFQLEKSHVLNNRSTKIKYYVLGSFGVYEQIPIIHKNEEKLLKRVKQKFTSWTPWGDNFEVNSVRDLSKAYDDFLKYNPSLS